MKINPFRVAHYSLLVLSILFLITGFGITQYRIIETITFGLLNKAVSLWLHSFLVWLFVPLLGFHVYMALKKSR